MATRSLTNTLQYSWLLISGSGILGLLDIIHSNPSMINSPLPGRYLAMLWTSIVFSAAGGIAMIFLAFQLRSVDSIILE